MERLLAGLQPALNSVQDAAWSDAASGIMTTDTVPKGASEQFELDGMTYTMTGISKGAGDDPSKHGNYAELCGNRCAYSP